MFLKRFFRKKVLINHFVKSLQRQAYADVLLNRFNEVAGLLQHMCFLVNIAKFFDSKSPVASVDLLFLIKSNVGWFLLKRVDLVVVRVI